MGASVRQKAIACGLLALALVLWAAHPITISPATWSYVLLVTVLASPILWLSVRPRQFVQGAHLSTWLSHPLGLVFTAIVAFHAISFPAAHFLGLYGVPSYRTEFYNETSYLVVALILAYATTAYLASLACRRANSLPTAKIFVRVDPVLQKVIFLGSLASVLLAVLVLARTDGPYGSWFGGRGFEFYAAVTSSTAVVALFVAFYWIESHATDYDRRIRLSTHALVAAWVVLNLAVGERSPVLAVALAWLLSRPLTSRVFRISYLLPLLLLLTIALTATGSLRALSPDGRGEPLGQMFVSSTSGAPNIASWVVGWNDGAFGRKYGGRTFLGSAVSLVPTITSKPHDGPLEFQLRYGGRSTPDLTRGYGYSLLAEGYMNWGTPGAAVVGILLGGSMVFGWSRARLTRGIFAVLYYVYFLVTTPYALRTDSFGAFKLWAYGALVIAGLAWLAKHLTDTAHAAPVDATTVTGWQG